MADGASHLTPTCPLCSLRDADRVYHPRGQYLCNGCGLLYSGTEIEWQNMAKRREARKRELERAADVEQGRLVDVPLERPANLRVV